MYLLQQYVIKFVSNLCQIFSLYSSFLHKKKTARDSVNNKLDAYTAESIRQNFFSCLFILS